MNTLAPLKQTAPNGLRGSFGMTTSSSRPATEITEEIRSRARARGQLSVSGTVLECSAVECIKESVEGAGTAVGFGIDSSGGNGTTVRVCKGDTIDTHHPLSECHIASDNGSNVVEASVQRVAEAMDSEGEETDDIEVGKAESSKQRRNKKKNLKKKSKKAKINDDFKAEEFVDLELGCPQDTVSCTFSTYADSPTSPVCGGALGAQADEGLEDESACKVGRACLVADDREDMGRLNERGVEEDAKILEILIQEKNNLQGLSHEKHSTTEISIATSIEDSVKGDSTGTDSSKTDQESLTVQQPEEKATVLFTSADPLIQDLGNEDNLNRPQKRKKIKIKKEKKIPSVVNPSVQPAELPCHASPRTPSHTPSPSTSKNLPSSPSPSSPKTLDSAFSSSGFSSSSSVVHPVFPSLPLPSVPPLHSPPSSTAIPKISSVSSADSSDLFPSQSHSPAHSPSHSKNLSDQLRTQLGIGHLNGVMSRVGPILPTPPHTDIVSGESSEDADSRSYEEQEKRQKEIEIYLSKREHCEDIASVAAHVLCLVMIKYCLLI